MLLIFQAMDAAGKDGTIKHVMSGVNPQGVQVYSFKAPSTRGARPRLPVALQEAACRSAAGSASSTARTTRTCSSCACIPRCSSTNKLPPSLVTKNIWEERFEDINAFERYLARNGYVILKFFLHVSKEEQKRRFLARLDEPAKNWKFSPATPRSAATGTTTWRRTRT